MAREGSLPLSLPGRVVGPVNPGPFPFPLAGTTRTRAALRPTSARESARHIANLQIRKVAIVVPTSSGYKPYREVSRLLRRRPVSHALRVRHYARKRVEARGGPRPYHKDASKREPETERRLRALTPVEPNRPGVDRVDAEVRLTPRIGGERRANRRLRLRLDDVHDVVLVAERSAEDDEALVEETVHVVRVRAPPGLLLERLREVALRPRPRQHDVEHRHRATCGA